MSLEKKDKKYLWHPFTQMADWIDDKNKIIIIKKTKGIYLYDQNNKKYIDGNSSIWTNIHGHCHPKIHKAITKQSKKLDHSSFLGYSNDKAIILAKMLINKINDKNLQRVFFSSDGSSACECALKMTIQYWQLKNKAKKSKFISFQGAYHGDTAGASSLSGINTFSNRFKDISFPVRVLNKADELKKINHKEIAGVIIEPIVQGANRMNIWKHGTLKKLKSWCTKNNVILIYDEIMTAFGRTGKTFAFQHENVAPDILLLGKALSGGTLPIASTICTNKIFSAFLEKNNPQKTFYYGHSYTANPIACASAIASLKLYPKTTKNLSAKITKMAKFSKKYLISPKIKNYRHIGMILAIDIHSRNPSAGAEICHSLRKYKILTRPILNTIIFMPPLTINKNKIKFCVKSISKAISNY